MLKFLYCGDFPHDISLSPEVYLPIAEKYGIEELKEKAARWMERGIANENVIERVILAHLMRCSSLKKACFRHLKMQPPLSAEALEPLKSHPDVLIDYIRYDPC